MDSLPPINKVFSLISQGEYYNKIGSHINASSYYAGTMAFAVKTTNSKAFRGYKRQKKDRPFCTHCSFHGLTIDKCYKIHGYPPGYKRRQKNNSTYSNNNTAINQVSNQSFSNSAVKTNQLGGVEDLIQNLNPNQYQQLMSTFSTHLASSVKPNNDHQDALNASYNTGICLSISLNPIFSSTQLWIVDLGATRHICSSATTFVSLR